MLSIIKYYFDCVYFCALISSVYNSLSIIIFLIENSTKLYNWFFAYTLFFINQIKMAMFVFIRNNWNNLVISNYNNKQFIKVQMIYSL